VFHHSPSASILEAFTRLLSPLRQESAGMKAEERHELRENDLANWLQYGLWAFLKNNGSYFLLIAALAFLGYRLWVLYESKQEVARQVAFANLEQDENAAKIVTTPEDWSKAAKGLEELVDTADAKLVKARACLALGQLYDFWAAFPEMRNFTNRSRDDFLSDSYKHFTQALQLQGDDPLIAAKAHLGIASVYEDQGEWDKAKAEYQRMIDNQLFAGDLAALARNYLDSMDSRRNAPRLADMIPIPAVTRPPITPGFPGLSLPGGGVGGGLLGPTTGSAFPGLLSPPTGAGSGRGATSAPAPFLPFGPMPGGPETSSGPPSILGGSPLTPTTSPSTRP
jgi:tetratricopeptide (TPR) repeat protein